MTHYSPVLEAMVMAATRAGDGLREDFSRPDLLEVTEKGTSDFVSNADLRSEKTLRGVLSAAFPDAGFLLEEGGATTTTSGARFIADPLDGTTNFIRGIPHFAVAIAFEEDGVVKAGVIVDPMKREVFAAERGKGIWLSERPARVSPVEDLSAAIVGTGIPHRGRGDHKRYVRQIERVMAQVAGVRRMGAAALDLAYVAVGRFDAFFETGLAPWDVAAGALLVEQAGGVVTKTDGRREALSGDVLATANSKMHEAMLGLLHEGA